MKVIHNKLAILINIVHML